MNTDMPTTAAANTVPEPAWYVPVIVWAGPIMTVPQIYEIWTTQNASGVSLLSWAAYSALSLFWLFYGVSRRDGPVTTHNFLYLTVCLLVVTGTLLYS